MKIKLIEGIKYDVDSLVFACFADEIGQSVSRPEYDFLDWFDDDGQYTGPDEDGLEPKFEQGSVKRADNE
jgi:hypothetical protein